MSAHDRSSCPTCVGYAKRRIPTPQELIFNADGSPVIVPGSTIIEHYASRSKRLFAEGGTAQHIACAVFALCAFGLMLTLWIPFLAKGH